MAEYFALQAAFFFAISHIFIRRGLVTSDAFTGSFISLVMTAVTLVTLSPLFIPLSLFWTPAVGYFIAAGIFAPALGRIFSYKGIERVGVGRSVPIANSSPMFSSILAVLVLGEIWTLQNFLGTTLVVLGVVILSRTHRGLGQWRKIDLVYPLAAALSFGMSAILRKLGLLVQNVPLVAATVTSTAGLLFAMAMLQMQGGWRALALSRRGSTWFFAAGLCNTSAMLSVFYGLSFGRVVIVEPLAATNPVLAILLSAIFLKDLEVVTFRVVVGALCTVVGTMLGVTS